jgi:branched-chain amino acid transport system substrate-binding protein
MTLGSRRAAILYDAGADYNSGLADAFRQQYRAIGGEVVADEAYQSGDVDFNAQVTRIKAYLLPSVCLYKFCKRNSKNTRQAA